MAANPAVDALQTAALLRALQDDARFQAVLAEVGKTYRPLIPSFEPQATTEGNLALMERIKFSFGMQKGFDLLYSLLAGRNP